MTQRELANLSRRLRPLATKRMPLAEPPPRDSRFGSPLELRKVRWVKPKLVAEVTFLTWTDSGLLRQVIYQGLTEDKPASKVRLEQSWAWRPSQSPSAEDGSTEPFLICRTR
jgi:ATP-dependent DNA ligase